jgi:hypothetical protein
MSNRPAGKTKDSQKGKEPKDAKETKEQANP